MFRLFLKIFSSYCLVFNIYAAQEVVGYDVQAVDILAYCLCSMIAHATDKVTALYQNVDGLWYNEFYATTEGMDFYLLILCDGGIAQIHTDAAAESIKAGTVEWLPFERILIATIACCADDALAVFTYWQRTLQPLVRVVLVATDNQFYTYIYNQTCTKIGSPRLLPQPVKMHDSPYVGQFQHAGYHENDSKNSSSSHNFVLIDLYFRQQRYEEVFIPPNIWDILHESVINGE